MQRTVRITVAKRGLDRELSDALVPAGTTIDRCPVFRDGQEFLVEGWPEMPDGFCENAWGAVRTGAMLAAFDADLSALTVPGKWIACCPDGLRPVVFVVELVDAPDPQDAKEDA